MKFGNQLAFVDTKIVEIGFWEFLPQIWMGILNVHVVAAALYLQ